MHRPRNLIGPLFFYDLVRLARRGRSTLLRCVYALALLAALCFSYYLHFPGSLSWQGALTSRTRLPLRDLADFNRGFLLIVLLTQSAAVLLLTPIYFAGAIAEERENKTLLLLFSTPLLDREIILGKLCARLAHLGNVLLAGVPIVLLTTLIGGGNILVLVAVFLVTAMTLLSVGSLSLYFSVRCRNAMTALLSSYGSLLLLNILCIPILWLSSPIAFLLVLNARLADLPALGTTAAARPLVPSAASAASIALLMAVPYVLLHGFLAWICIRAAIEELRAAKPEPIRRAPPPRPRLVPVSTAIDVEDRRSVEPVARVRSSLLPPLRGDPLLWKEMVHDPPARPAPLAGILWRVGAAVLLGSATFWLLVIAGWACLQDNREQVAAALNGLLRGLSIGLMALWCGGVAFRTSSSLSRERERRTLAMLLTIPMEREVILHAKWLGAILRLRTLGLCLLGVWALGLFTGALHPLAVLLLLGSCAVYLIFLASLGVWLSLVCRNTLWAQLSMALMLLLLFVGAWLQLINQPIACEFSNDAGDWWSHVWQVGLNPFASWWLTGFSGDEWREAMTQNDELFRVRLRAILYGLALLVLLAGLFGVTARRRLRTEPRR